MYLFKAAPKPSVPEVSLLFDQGKGNTVFSQSNLPRAKSSSLESSKVYDQSRSNTVSSIPTTTRSQEISNNKYTEKEAIPVTKHRTESYNVWRSRNSGLISGSKERVGQGYESCMSNNYNYHSTVKAVSDGNVISAGNSQPIPFYSGHPSHRTEEVNVIKPLDYRNRDHYNSIHGPKEPLIVSDVDYVTRLNKYNSATLPSGIHSDTHVPNNEYTLLHPTPEPKPYVNAMKQFSITSPTGNKCDTKYYHSKSADIPCEDLVQRRELHNHSYRNTTHIPLQENTYHHNNDYMFTQNQCKSGCHDCMHNVTQKNVCCNIPPECTSPNSCHNCRQELGHGCYRNFNNTHVCNSCPPIQNQSRTNDDVHSMLNDLHNTVKLQTEQIVILQKQIGQLLQLQIDTHKYISCSLPIIKTSENFPNGNCSSPENIRIKQANRMQSSEHLPVIEENEQSTEKSKVSVGVVTSFHDSTSKKDTSDDSHCNCYNKSKLLPKEVTQKPSQEKPAYYEEPTQHDKEIKAKPTKPAHSIKTIRYDVKIRLYMLTYIVVRKCTYVD